MSQNATVDRDAPFQASARVESELLKSVEEKKAQMLMLMASMQQDLDKLRLIQSNQLHESDEPRLNGLGDDKAAVFEKESVNERRVKASVDKSTFLHHLRSLEAHFVILEKSEDGAEDSSSMSAKHTTNDYAPALPNDWKWPLSSDDYQRYGRQLIMPEMGLQGQLRLKASSVLIIGVGGLGCPAAAYLAGAGIGTIGLVDGDTVETSNLHRQILHNTSRVGNLKVDSAVEYLHALNPTITYITHPDHLTPHTALPIITRYDLVLDCTDHPTSRYLISDACVLACKPFVSASALRTDGQLMALNYPAQPAGDPSPQSGPCYRCVFPRPPPAESVVSCGEGGILGPVVGVMGVLQALQAIKMLVEEGGVKIGDMPESATSTLQIQPSLLIFSAFASQPFRTIRLRSRRAGCASCSAQASISPEALRSGSLDYVAFCGVARPVQTLRAEERVGVSEMQKLLSGARTDRDKEEVKLVDVREKVHFDLCSIPGSVNVPWSEMVEWKTGADAKVLSGLEEAGGLGTRNSIHVICRLGNDSQLAVRKMKELGLDGDGQRFVGDVKGGLRAWRNEIDPTWPDL